MLCALRHAASSSRSLRFQTVTPSALAKRTILSHCHYSSSSITPVDLGYDLQTPEDGNTRESPLVILHGLFGSKRNWLTLARAFQRDLKRPIYALDLRNQGHSPHAEPMTYEAMAADIMHFFKQHSLTNVSLLGHSMGGKVAMSVALSPSLPPSLLSHLIIADIAPVQGDLSAEFKGYVKGMQEIEERNIRTRKEAHEILRDYEPDPSVRAFLLTNLDPVSAEETDPDAYAKFRVPLDLIDSSIGEIGNFPYQPGERTWEGRTMLIKGSESRYVNRHNIPVAKQFFPDLILGTLQAGHWVHAEKPNEFKKLVVDFIS